VSLAEIAAGLRAWRTRVETMRVRSRWTHQNLEKAIPTQTAINSAEGVWSKSGKHRMYWKPDERVAKGSLWSYDGRYRFTFDSVRGDPPKDADRVRIEEIKPSRGFSALFLVARDAPHLGMVVTGERNYTWLDELIEVGNVRLAGTEILAGRKLPVLELLTGTECVGFRQPQRITVDPFHGYLVKKHERCGEIYVTEEFREISPPGVWFPVKGYFETWHKGDLQYRTNWQVQSVKLNEQLDDALFHPKIPAGAKIDDHTRGNVFTPKPPPAEPSVRDRIQLWLAWLVGAAVAAACGWMIVRTWKHLRRSIDN
jgi:hypothetical protein